MKNKDIPLITYQEVLNQIENKDNSLLIANGFNYGLGVHTGYSDIFQRMIKDNNGIYVQAKSLIEKCGYDLEMFLGEIEKDIKEDNVFLRKYTKNKIKYDFMQTLNEIVKEKTNSIYKDKNEGIFILLKQFTNYFTLNYDTFLYMLLLKFKPLKTNNNAIAFEESLPFIEKDLDKQHEDIYTEIKNARKNGKLEIDSGENRNPTKSLLSLIPKTQFISVMKTYAQTDKKKWTDKTIKEVVDKILDEEKRNSVLSHVDDGSRQLSLFGNDFVFDVNSETQNLFFLHGAFHIIKEGKEIKKITQSTDKALYEKLEEILNDDNKDIVCIFQSENKLDAIQDNPYLLHCYNKLAELTGNLVIIGSSLDNNDNHIFKQINNSQIKKVFISTLKRDEDENRERARLKFPKKDIYLFDASTISYEIPDTNIVDNS